MSRPSQELGFGGEALAYRGGETAQNELIAERIRSGEQVLCFASPEAVCGRLRRPLEDAAAAGLLRALVVDEAHLIDSWGINFRPDFQMLAGVRRQLLTLSAAREFRTLLLSATLTSDTVRVLRNLFPPVAGARFGLVSAAALRPEIDYWIAPAMEGELRIERTIEALHHLPRPLILYTTERWMARDWHRRIGELGFRRVGIVTGATPTAQRERAVEGWRNGSIDIIVGTSAFGLGIDNPHVRAVIHACVPETLDRFYQEVGRGGRDGHASVSLTVPIDRDMGTARSLSRKRLLLPETSQRRWRAMFEHPDREDLTDGRYRLRVDVRPDFDSRHIDMVNSMNTDWNMRTLVLMAASGAITLEDIDQQLIERTAATRDEDRSSAPEPKVRYAARPLVTVTVDDSMHMSAEFWEDHIPAFRKAQDAGAAASLRRLRDFLSRDSCSADAIGPLYEIPSDGEAGYTGRLRRSGLRRMSALPA